MKKFKEKMQKTIKTKITVTVLAIVIISMYLLGSISIYLNYSSTMSTLEQNMTEAAELASERVQWELQSYLNLVTNLGATARIAKDSATVEEKQTIIDERVKAYDMERGNILDKDGTSIFSGEDFSDRAYFQAAIKGETYVSEPLISKVTGDLTVIIAAPLWKDGLIDTEVIGVVYIVPHETFLNDIVTSIQISKNGSSYMLDGSGTVIAHKNMELVTTQDNSIEASKTDSSVKSVAKLEERMVAGETGFGTYKYGGVNKLLAYAPVDGTNGWSIAITAPLSDFISETIIGIIITVVLIVFSIFIAIILVRRLANAIGEPIKLCANRLELLAEGDLHTEVPAIKSKDETLILANATEKIVEGMEKIIGDIKYLLQSMAEDNFDVHSQANEFYVGDFEAIITAIRQINRSLSNTLKQIKESADQVSIGSEQLASSGQALAEGATEQAGAIEELLATVSNVSEQVSENTKNAVSTSHKANNIGAEARTSSSHMAKMTQAMQKINDASMEIAHIIQTIEEIAEQTNLLSLNAAIEAARAGEAGKGFAVVAGEIGQLAKQSSEAAVDTKKLIEAALDEVKNGNQIADNTAQALQTVIQGMEDIVHAIETVAEYSNEQNESMGQINQAIEQISGVVQSNSASAEESSATSEELSAQAVELNDLIGKFKLRQ